MENLTANESYGILDPFEESKEMPGLYTAFIISEILKILTGIVGLAANMFLAITIMRFKKLKTRLNTFILNITILNIISYIAMPICEIISLIVGHTSDYNVQIHVFVWLYFMECTCIMFGDIISFAMALDWFMMTFKQTWILRTKTLYKYELLILHILAGVWYITMIICYYQFHNYIDLLVYVIIYAFIIVGLIFINIYSFVHKIPYECTKTKYALTVANILVFSYIPEFIKLFVIFYVDYFGIYRVFKMFDALTLFIVYASPIVVVAYLGTCNKYFKMAFDKSFKRNVQSYDTDNLDGPDEV